MNDTISHPLDDLRPRDGSLSEIDSAISRTREVIAKVAGERATEDVHRRNLLVSGEPKELVAFDRGVVERRALREMLDQLIADLVVMRREAVVRDRVAAAEQELDDYRLRIRALASRINNEYEPAAAIIGELMRAWRELDRACQTFRARIRADDVLKALPSLSRIESVAEVVYAPEMPPRGYSANPTVVHLPSLRHGQIPFWGPRS